MYKAILILVLFFSTSAYAQELKARVSVISNRVANNVDKKTFQTLQTALDNFVNNRKWSADNFAQQEKIDCSFLLNLESTDEANVYKGSLTIQSARPIFNSTYVSPIINFQDNDLIFKYAEFQQLEFNDNRVSGTDPDVSNLTAVFAYYINIILGMDYDSFSPRGGDPFFQKAQNIVNNAPEGKNISGWKAFDGTRNRYWLAENLLNSRYTIIHDAIYSYYRQGMDKLYDEEANARIQILNVLNLLNNLNTENPNTMIMQFFFQGKMQELINVFSKASPPDKSRALEFLQKLDVPNAPKYKEALK
ncbi:DUF4835 family protein [Ginsengibacter hankyongi]|uniref:DUF4835 family protein n=1 Tax=Ginsengibacter hankyongi TaxID=2607284 RepID=A0A5J5ICU1_9BACT|nr:DUF4835 family protein [Ginsengibacter hankyongi]KAA9036598.1 DUF4835 family protein [Ginsengibacter hankyongi]